MKIEDVSIGQLLRGSNRLTSALFILVTGIKNDTISCEIIQSDSFGYYCVGKTENGFSPFYFLPASVRVK
jgi:hypothetical protein